MGIGKGKNKAEKWIKQYCSNHRILVVGEGDFSFAAWLGRAFGCAANMVATSPHSRDVLRKKFPQAMANLNELQELGCRIIYGVDTKTIAKHSALNMNLYDRIVYNLPDGAGVFHSESSAYQNKMLVNYFLRSAQQVLTEEGEVHVKHKSAHPWCRWEMQQLAFEAGLRFIIKRECSTYMFRKFHKSY